ncbi:cytochrome p450 4c1, partial [Lasius niger]
MFVLLTKPKDVKLVLTNANGNYKSTSITKMWQEILGNGIITISEKESNGHIFDIKPYMTRYVCDTFLATMAGIEGKAQRGDYDDILYWHDRLFKLIYNRTIKPWLHSERNFSLCENAKQMHRGLKVVRDFSHD